MGHFYSFRENRRIKMNNDQSDCLKCSRRFNNKGSLAHHQKSCFEDREKMSKEMDPLALDEMKAPDDGGWDKMEKHETQIEGDVKEEAVIEILDIDEEPEEKQSVHDGNPPSVPGSRNVFKAPLSSRGKAKRGRLDCYYCGQSTSDRISLTKHLVGQHWDLVRDRQGGGRKDNSQFYFNMQDSRVLKPLKPGLSNRNYHGGQLPPNRKILPNLPSPTYNWTAQIKDQDFHHFNKKDNIGGAFSPSGTQSASRYSNSFYGKTQHRKIMPKLSYSGTVSSVTNPVSLYGKIPNRKIVPKTSNNVQTSQAKRNIPTYDLTTSSVERRRSQPGVTRASKARSAIPNTNHRSLNKVGPNSKLHKLVNNSNLQITKVCK